MIVLFRMLSKYFLVLIVIYIKYVECARYKILIEDPEVFTPCARDPDHFILDFVDVTRLNRTMLRDGNIYVNGNVELVKDLPKPVKLSVLVYKKVGSNWVSTVMNMQKPDLCEALKEQHSFWSTVVGKMEVDPCPFHKGFGANMDLTMEFSLNIPALRAEGQYRVELLLSTETIPDVYCLQGEVTAVLDRK